MGALGLLVLVTGAYLIDSAVVNRKPVQTLLSIITNPSAARANLAASRGTGFASAVFVPDASTGGGATIPKTTTSAPGAGAASTAGQGAVAFARTQIGKPYKYGGTGPNSWDCSGLAQAAYRSVGIKIPRTTVGQRVIGKGVSKANLQIGDLVFPDLHHVQLYSGGGKVIEAPSTGKLVREVPMWGFTMARRP